MGRVLVVEDEAALREAIVEELQEAGHETREAAHGAAGLAAILDDPPDLVISDIFMPEMDGHALLRAVRHNHPDLASLPFVYLTALAEKQDMMTGFGLGADDYLTKPVDFDLLRVRVEARLRNLESTTAAPGLVSDRLSHIARNSRAEADKLLREIHEDGRLRFREATNRNHQRAPFVCASLGEKVVRKVNRLRMARGDSVALRAEIDVLVLGLATRHIFDTAGQSQMIVVPVEYSTIAVKNRQSRYHSLCTALTTEARHRLMFSIRNRPVNLPPEDEVISRLATASRLRILHLRQPDFPGIDFQVSKISLVSIDFGVFDQVRREQPGKIGGFIAMARAKKVRTLVDHAEPGSDPPLLRAGVDFVGRP